MRLEKDVPVIDKSLAHGKADVEDPLCDIGVILDVDDDDVFGVGGDDGGDGADEEVVELGQEGRLCDVVESDRDAVYQHVLRHQPHKHLTCRLHRVDAIWNREKQILKHEQTK